MKKHNFNVGPSILPREVIENTAQAILDFNGSGLTDGNQPPCPRLPTVVIEAVALSSKELLNLPQKGIRYCSWAVVPVWNSAWYPSTSLKRKAAYPYGCKGQRKP